MYKQRRFQMFIGVDQFRALQKIQATTGASVGLQIRQMINRMLAEQAAEASAPPKKGKARR